MNNNAILNPKWVPRKSLIIPFKNLFG
jgi:hypothetical protein